MNRRRCLTLGGTAFATALAGCQSGSEDGSSPAERDGTGESAERSSSSGSAASITVDEIRAPATASVGEELVAAVAVTNGGDQTGTYSGTLTVAGQCVSGEETVEATVDAGETTAVEAAALVPECEGELSMEMADVDLSHSVEVGHYPTPRSEVDDHRYSETNAGVTEAPGPSSRPEEEQTYEDAISPTMRIHEDALATVSPTTSGSAGKVRVLEPDGTERWTDTLHYPSTEPALFGDRLYVVDANDLLCYDVETGEKRWTFTEAGPPSDEVTYTEMHGTPLVSDGAVYFNGMFGRVWAVNAYSGRKQWSTSLTPDEEENPISGVPSVHDGTLYVVGDDGLSRSDRGPLYALDANTGEVQWKTGADILVGETTPVRGSHVYARAFERDGFSTTETVRAYDTAGNLDWETELDELDTAVVVDDERVYVGRAWPTSNASGELVALDRSTGDVEWRREADAGIADAPTVGANGLFVTDWDDALYSIDPASGAVQWKAVDLVYRSTPTVHGNRLVMVSSRSNSVAAFE